MKFFRRSRNWISRSFPSALLNLIEWSLINNKLWTLNWRCNATDDHCRLKMKIHWTCGILDVAILETVLNHLRNVNKTVQISEVLEQTSIRNIFCRWAFIEKFCIIVDFFYRRFHSSCFLFVLRTFGWNIEMTFFFEKLIWSILNEIVMTKLPIYLNTKIIEVIIPMTHWLEGYLVRPSDEIRTS